MNTPEIKAVAEAANNIISRETYSKMKNNTIILPAEMDKRILSKARETDRNRYRRKKYVKAAVFFAAFLMVINIAVAYSAFFVPEMAGTQNDTANIITDFSWEVGYLPEGFSCYDSQKTKKQELAIYKTADGDKSIVIYHSSQNLEETDSIFENIEAVEINGVKGIIKYNENKNSIVLEWENKGYFKIEGINVYDLSEIKAIARNITINNNL